MYIQWLSFENRQGPVHEAKMLTSDEYNTVQKCSHAIDYQRHQYHASALSNEVHNFVLAQGAQKL